MIELCQQQDRILFYQESLHQGSSWRREIPAVRCMWTVQLGSICQLIPDGHGGM